MKKLFYIRHGQADANVANVFGGHSEALLTKVGESQAKQAGKDAKANLPSIDVIICSPLKRAFRTAELIAKEVGYPVNKIERNPLFIERGYGILEGTKAKDFFDTHKPEELDSVQGVEAVEQLQKRAAGAFLYLKSRQEHNILIVSHGAFGNAFISAIKKLPYSYGAFSNEPENAKIVELI